MNNGVLYTHSAFEQLVQGSAGDVHAFGKLFNAQAFVVPKDIGSLVVALGRACSPSAIFVGVAKIVVFPVNRHSIRAHAHIEKEPFEAIGPFRTNRNSPSAVAGIIGIIRVLASRLHRLPRTIGWRSTEGMGSAHRPDHLFSQAATTLGVPSGQLMSSDGNRVSAITLTIPQDPFAIGGRAIVDPFYDNKVAVFQSGSVDEFAHDSFPDMSALHSAIKGKNCKPTELPQEPTWRYKLT